MITLLDWQKKLLEDNDWIVNCESPLEVEHKETGDTATGFAVEVLVDYYYDIR
jgi:hypothetical protein